MRKKIKINSFFSENLDCQDCDTRKKINDWLRQFAFACFEFVAETKMEVSEFLVTR